ncbi:MAG: LPS assembly protein LptD, partial [Patescibacteria group bacterium]
KIAKRISENELEVINGYITTCDREHPHYRMQSRRLQIFPEDKVTAKAMTMRIGNTPILYMPKFTQNLKDDRMHVQVSAGKSKDWGAFILTAWRYDLLQNSGGRIHLDLREKKQLAWGIDNYYDTKIAGKGYFKTYYMNESKLARKHFYYNYFAEKPPGKTSYKERYRIQWRHKWDVDKNTYYLAEYHKISDTKFIKDYFFREYEKNSQPPSYLLFNHYLPDSSTLSILTQKRTNRIFSETEKLPEVKFDKPNTRISTSPVFIANNTSYASFNRKTATLPGDTNWEADESNQRIDTYNRLSLPFKFAYLDLNPYTGTRETYFRRISGREVGIFREIWDSGINLTTRFYRIFDVDSQMFGIKINKLRHIISPTLSYTYIHPPTVSASKLLQFDGIDSIGETNQLGLSLENKLQTKRMNKTVDFLRFIAGTDYFFNVEGRKRKWSDNIIFDLEMLPYDWMRFESDATLDRKKSRFTFANFDLKASGKDVSFGGGYRYERKSSSQMTGEIMFNLIKGWSFKVYERFQFIGNSLVKEQNYVISKELHCWILDINYNVLRERGETIWFALRLKAFPEMSIDYNQIYHEPKPGSQGYPGGKSSD